MITTPRTLEQLQNRPTSYEVVAKTEAGTVRLGFTERTTKRALLTVAQANGETLLGMIGDWDGEATHNRITGWTFGPVRVCLSGRTERDCTMENITASRTVNGS